MADWTTLTRIEQKHSLYHEETYFREAVADFSDVLGASAEQAARDIALLMVKPDGLAARKIGAVLDFLRDNEFTIVSAQWAALTGKVWRELWRYQLNAATLDRLMVNEIVLSSPGLLMLLRHDAAVKRLPAAVTLSELKGPADVSLQDENCLRRRLAQPNRVFSMVHVANEPADVLRELGVLLDRPGRLHAFTALRDGVLPEPDRARLDEALLADRDAPEQLDPIAAAHRVTAAVDAADSTDAALVRATMARVIAGDRIEWRPFEAALAATGADVAHWDLATLGASCITYDEPDRRKTIENVDPDLWVSQAIR